VPIKKNSCDDSCKTHRAVKYTSLEELRALSTQTLTKSGINHRFSKILKIADQIKNNKE
jgi:DNA-binding transcriptional regulator WhiA